MCSTSDDTRDGRSKTGVAHPRFRSLSSFTGPFSILSKSLLQAADSSRRSSHECVDYAWPSLVASLSDPLNVVAPPAAHLLTFNHHHFDHLWTFNEFLSEPIFCSFCLVKLVPMADTEDNTVQCPICCEDLPQSDEDAIPPDVSRGATGDEHELVAHLPCDHVAHDRCVKPWFERENTCPNCRATVNVVRISSTVNGSLLVLSTLI